MWWQSLPKLKLGSNERKFYADFEFYRFVFGKLCRKAPQQKRASEVTNFTNKKGTILQIFQKSGSTLALWELIPQKLLSFEQNPSGMALVMTCRVCLTKKVNLSFWRVLVTVPSCYVVQLFKEFFSVFGSFNTIWSKIFGFLEGIIQNYKFYLSFSKMIFRL